MREINLRAEHILLEHKREIRREILFVRIVLLGAVLCAGAGACALYGNAFIILPAVFGGALFIYTCFAEGIFLAGRLYYLSGNGEAEPLIRVKLVMRFARFKVTEGLVKFIWLNFFLLPSRIAGLIIIRTLYVTGNIQRVMLLTLIAAFFVLGAAGLIFYFYLSGRYFLSELLFLRCPGQKPREIIKNSALLSSGRLREIIFFRIRNALSYAWVKRKIRSAVFACDLFSDRGFYKNYGLVSPLTFREPF